MLAGTEEAGHLGYPGNSIPSSGFNLEHPNLSGYPNHGSFPWVRAAESLGRNQSWVFGFFFIPLSNSEPGMNIRDPGLHPD